MIAERKDYQKMTPEEYLEWEAQQEFRYEYIDGEILAMTGGSIPHTKIYLNFYRALYPHLSQRGCEAYVSDLKVQDSKNNRYFYADLVVTCNAEDLKSLDFIEHPKVIVEVLSPSTAKYDGDDKLKLGLTHQTGFINEISWFEQQDNGNKPGFLVTLRKS